jgi:probable HAF family extracellular repeat protein
MYITTLTLLAALAVPVQLAAQNNGKQDPPHQPHHYQLVDLTSTFGGPQSYFVPGSGLDFAGASVLNKRGTATGIANTSTSDPFPNFCFDGFFANSSDCYVSHAFQEGSGGVVTDLGALPGGGSSAPMWITPNGLIAGLSENGQTDPLYAGLPQLRAVLWQQGNIVDLGTLDGGYQSIANAMNSSGSVVGVSTNTTLDTNSMEAGIFMLYGGNDGIAPPYQYQTRAFLWDKEKGMQDLGTLPGGTDAQAMLINERGQVVGESYTASTQSGACYPLASNAFLWEKEKGMTDLGGFGGTCTAVAALNNRGQVVGESFRKGDKAAPGFLWENGTLYELRGSLGGDFTGAFAINEQGNVAGFAYLSGNSTFHATLWKNRNQFKDLGVVGGDPCSYAAAINAKMQVVGASIADCDDEFRAFLWEDGSIFDLNSLIPPASALYLQFTFAINDRGEIAGQGVDSSGNEHAFLLIPCDENHPGIDGCDYSLVDAAEAARVSTARSPKQKLPAGIKLRGVRGLFLGPLQRTPTATPHDVGRQAVSTPLGDDRGPVEKPGIAREVSDESGRSAQHKANAETSSCSTSERGASNGEVPARGYLVHGSCSVNENENTLTGYCQGPLLFSHTCSARRDASQCPSGQKAKEPEYVDCGNFGPFREDIKRPCQFTFE